MASIFTGHQGNLNASKLTWEQREQVRQDLALPPEARGPPAGFWDTPKMRTHLEAAFGVVYESDASYHYLMRFAGLELKYPDKLDLRRDDQAVEACMAEIREEVAPLLADPAWAVFAADEVRLDQEAITHRAWLPVGRKAILKVDRQVKAQSYLGLLNQAGGRFHLFRVPWQKSETIITALEEFLKGFPDKKVAIVWDNAAFHKSKAMRRFYCIFRRLTPLEQRLNHERNTCSPTPEHRPSPTGICIRASGLLDHPDSPPNIGYKAYIGLGMITHNRKPPGGELADDRKQANQAINRIRA
jgi:hypothetical protein